MFWDQVRSFTPRYRASLSYVTGAQNLKVGIETYNNISTRNYQRGDWLQYRFNNGVPNQLTMLLNDFTEEAHVQNIGHLRAESLDDSVAFTLRGRHPLRERLEQLARAGDRAVALRADADRVPGAGHREGLQRHHAPRRSGDRPDSATARRR